MQVFEKSKYIILFSIFLLIALPVYAQKSDTETIPDTIINKNDTVKSEKKFSIRNIFKKQNKKKQSEISDSSSSEKKKLSLRNFKRKNKSDSTKNDSLTNDSLSAKDSSEKNKKGTEKPQRITPSVWLSLNAAQQDSLLKAWDDYDREFYVKKYKTSKFIKKTDMKRDKNFAEKFILRHTTDKSYKYRKKLINRRISRYKKTMRYDRFKKSETAPNDSLSDQKRYQTVNKKFKREAKQEAVRKNKVILKYDKKEERLRKRYKLSENEIKVLNKGKGMRLKGTEKIIFNKALKKQEKFTEKLLKLRRKRSFALQNKEVQKRMKEDKKRIAKRDREMNKNLYKKKKDKAKNKKHDSSEYPRRFF